MKKYTLIATAPMGIEAIVAKEVRDLGYECKVDNGKVIFEGDALAICRANLWLRTADRIKVQVAEFQAKTFDELFEKTKAIDWRAYIPENAKFPVIGKSVKSVLASVPDCQRIVKKAIAEKLKLQSGKQNEWIEETGPEYKVEISLLKDKAVITLDSSGTGLHKRGYRVDQGGAPIKETLAAALVLLTNWTPDRPFVDPFCGSGTIAIEAALIGQNIAPGFNRDFVSEDWEWIGKELWDKARLEVEEKANYDQPLQIFASDVDHRMVNIAKENAEEAGLGDLIECKQMRVQDFTTKLEFGVIVGNPPYGERLGEKKEVERMYKEMGRAFESLDTWSVYMLTSNEQFEEAYGRKATKKRKLFNGFIKADYYQYWAKKKKTISKI
ncbi:MULTISPECIES: THUMP domain-containing class I SAM-dependent RNA methyltransferase [Bacillus amyloliquefaciens group]|uniref:Methylase with RNA interaction domain n=1 Tax=Bacillus amyloliquefaciens (strain ATCC 23350 / DSM 7 / BCRC 11601 / CCUG 28519 / NBRC 15535 / NRRL B-14393 / F) TaxID=692420 RepID=A0A9P1JI11_BACAS|nr:class I SAM-dependent RNA methyltransferase [Bacillus amyloliquefaciens]AIW35907.1 RNA methyltransferase [Bacillus subtilis]MBW8279117.1 class I SAM-dependent RNA methyltransferase [Bacillus amyloliquefaciens]MDR4377302.1 class I SAM-dependent RNA methyltransferase [Bacillus amyloliquefaciens]MEC1248925.1 class I SAM-dependent RNA methyltransferase [Bacillus amyloliquefaciens]MEC1832886.1 class I SAM-dependent RNA methyltransferase [Bacillus amyloliquefaciens]